jgi:hypothetical protein
LLNPKVLVRIKTYRYIACTIKKDKIMQFINFQDRDTTTLEYKPVAPFLNGGGDDDDIEGDWDDEDDEDFDDRLDAEDDLHEIQVGDDVNEPDPEDDDHLPDDDLQ